MELNEILESVMNALSPANIPTFHQFDEKLLAKRNDCFITVGLSDMSSQIILGNTEQYEIGVLVSLFAPSSYSGGKLLKMSKDIAPLILSSNLDVKSVKACALSYDKQSDRLRYDFTARIIATSASGSYNAERTSYTVSLSENLSLAVSEFTLSRKRAVYEIPSVLSGTLVTDNGTAPLKLKLSATMTLTASSIKELDDIAKGGTELSLALAGVDFPEMRICDYTLKQTGRETCLAEISFVGAISNEGMSESE